MKTVMKVPPLLKSKLGNFFLGMGCCVPLPADTNAASTNGAPQKVLDLRRVVSLPLLPAFNAMFHCQNANQQHMQNTSNINT